MQLTSIYFLFTFLIFYLAYWFVFNKNINLQNLLLLAGSYLFYSYSDWRFSLFLFFVSILNFYLGIQLRKNIISHKLIKLIAITQGIGGLIYFKYFNFFIESINDLFQAINLSITIETLQILAPIGISFYTFKTISYILDVSKKKIEPAENLVVFMNYVAFFPTILSGPIDRAGTFIPQLTQKRAFDLQQSSDGLKLILWGAFKKIVVADSCALVATKIFENPEFHTGSTFLVGSFLYAIQLYTDFSGYSDIAIGLSKLLGFNISNNFKTPYFSQNIADYWRRWHISLTNWLTEFVFTPLSIALRDYGKLGLILAIIANFTICGIWHGPKWTYIIYGFIHGCYFIPLIIRNKLNKKTNFNKEKGIIIATRIVLTFTLVMLTMIIFRAENMNEVIHIYRTIFSKSLFSSPLLRPNFLFILIVFLFFIEWKTKDLSYGFELNKIIKHNAIRYFIYLVIFYLVIFNYSFHKTTDFIYLQF